MHSVKQVWTFLRTVSTRGLSICAREVYFVLKNAVSLRVNLQPLKSATQMRQDLPTWARRRLKVVLPAASHSPPELLLFRQSSGVLIGVPVGR